MPKNNSRVRKKSIKQIRDQYGRIMDEIRRRRRAGTISSSVANQRAEKATSASSRYANNIEDRMLNTQRYQRAQQRAISADINRRQNPQEYREALRTYNDMYNNTAYSKNTYMGLNNG